MLTVGDHLFHTDLRMQQSKDSLEEIRTEAKEPSALGPNNQIRAQRAALGGAVLRVSVLQMLKKLIYQIKESIIVKADLARDQKLMAAVLGLCIMSLLLVLLVKTNIPTSSSNGHDTTCSCIMSARTADDYWSSTGLKDRKSSCCENTRDSRDVDIAKHAWTANKHLKSYE